MDLPFNTAEFLDIFKAYNETFFPLQIVFYVLAFVCVYMVLTKSKYTNVTVGNALAFFWFWMGLIYHLLYFSPINKAAFFFSILFVIQGIFFLVWFVLKNDLSLGFRNEFRNYIGIVFLSYSLIAYPILGHQLGHIYPNAPTFGLPCPTTIFTFGILLFSNNKIPLFLLIIPLLWSFIGFTAVIQLSMYEDIGLLIAGLVSVILILFNNKKFARTHKIKPITES